MISKKALKQRLFDICNGAGRFWSEDGEFFEEMEDCLESIYRTIQAIGRTFDLDYSHLQHSCVLSKHNNLDDLTDYVYSLLEIEDHKTKGDKK
jgi:hypothetical protein